MGDMIVHCRFYVILSIAVKFNIPIIFGAKQQGSLHVDPDDYVEFSEE